MSCPSCDRDPSYPGKPGHECYTYEQHAKWIRETEAREANENTRTGRP